MPVDHRSLAFLRAYGEAARKFENETDRPFTYVNCYDWTDVCAKEKITQYPTLKIFHQGKYLKDYGGMLSIEDVITAYKLYVDYCFMSYYLTNLKNHEVLRSFELIGYRKQPFKSLCLQQNQYQNLNLDHYMYLLVGWQLNCVSNESWIKTQLSLVLWSHHVYCIFFPLEIMDACSCSIRSSNIVGMLVFFFRLKQDKPVSLLEKNDIEKFLNGILPDGSNISGSVFVVGLFADAQSKGEKGFV